MQKLEKLLTKNTGQTNLGGKVSVNETKNCPIAQLHPPFPKKISFLYLNWDHKQNIYTSEKISS